MLSIKSKGETFTKPPKLVFDPTINNYINLWGNDLFKDTFFNSIFITLISIVLSITIALFAAYALKRYQFDLKQHLCNGYFWHICCQNFYLFYLCLQFIKL